MTPPTVTPQSSAAPANNCSGAGRGTTGHRAFTRVELCAGLAAAALLALLALPALASSQSRGQVAQCLNNLRLMGRAMQMWGSDNNSMLPPWRLRAASDGGGTVPPQGRSPATWFEYAYLSNQLVTPRILACPSDTGVLEARDFGQFISPSYRGNAVSYFINLHTSFDNPGAALFGDRNLRLEATGAACYFANYNNVLQFSAATAWTNGVHEKIGDLVTMDGGAALTGTPELQSALLRSQAEGSSLIHLLKAR